MASGNHPPHTMTRNGKIARLPRQLREQLNRRIDNGEQGVSLVDWLNRQPGVIRTLNEHFDGRLINEQNLSDWKQGGFLEWQRHQDTLEWVRTLSGEAEQIAEDAGVMPVSDQLSSIVSVTLGKMLRTFAEGPPPDAASRKEFLELLRELARLRREDREASRERRYLETCGISSVRRRLAAAAEA
jgi:hypothetical protein